MPVTIVVGGQFGSEGKGKVAHWLARRQQATYAVRVGGPNAGHTAVEGSASVVLRHLPTPALTGSVVAVIPAGAYLHVETLLREIEALGLCPESLLIAPGAMVIDAAMRTAEREGGLVAEIASTGQGVGSAVAQRAMRSPHATFAAQVRALRRFVCHDLHHVLAAALDRNERVLVEGTQGFGLSLLHGGHYPYATGRDTSAAGALSEAGLGPRAVDCVALVLRAFPIRVGGASGPLPQETDWAAIGLASGAEKDLTEYATVTKRPRRIARFDEQIVSRALLANRPDLLFLNHADYFDYSVHEQPVLSERAARAVVEIESRLRARIDHVGVGPRGILSRPAEGWHVPGPGGPGTRRP